MLTSTQPSDRGHPRAVAGIELLVRFGRHHGLSDETLLGGTGLGVDDLTASGREVTAAQELRVVRNLRHRLPDAGAAVGATYEVATFGVLGLALLASRTVLDAAEVTLRFLDLSFAFVVPRVTLAGDQVQVTLDGTDLPADVRSFLVARDTTAIDTVLRALVPGGVGAEVRLDTDRAMLVFAAAELDRPLPRNAGPSEEFARALCRDVVDDRRRRTGLVRDVQVLIVQRLAAGAPMAAVAADLGITERTLRRRLTADGVTYQGLLDEVRASIARRLLTGRATIAVAEVARQVGYTDPASFVRAHRRWTGTTPGQVR